MVTQFCNAEVEADASMGQTQPTTQAADALMDALSQGAAPPDVEAGSGHDDGDSDEDVPGAEVVWMPSKGG